MKFVLCYADNDIICYFYCNIHDTLDLFQAKHIFINAHLHDLTLQHCKSYIYDILWIVTVTNQQNNNNNDTDITTQGLLQ